MSEPDYASEAHRGALARWPTQFSWRAVKEVGLRVIRQLGQDQVAFISAGIAFYSLLAFVPLLVAIVAIYGIFSDPSEVPSQMVSLYGVVPSEAISTIEDQLTRVAANSGAAGFGTIFGLLLALWSGSKAFDAIIIGVNIVYGERERRSILVRKGTSLLMTLGSVVVGAIGVLAAIALPFILKRVQLGDLEPVIRTLRWPIILVVVMAWLTVLYRYAPCRKSARWRWLSWGGFLASLTWLLASAGLSFYVSNFGSYNESYGTLGGIIVLMLWFYVSGFAVLLGAEVNAELEHQTTRDSTVGPDKPLGERGAVMADQVVFDGKEQVDKPSLQEAGNEEEPENKE